MKTAVFVFFLFVASAAFAQLGSLGGPIDEPLQTADHTRHAEQHDMARPQNILEHSEYAYERGERPLWEFGAGPAPRPLGDVAREFRKQRALLRKADIIWEN
jgi:hypothetical protein